MTTVNGTGHAAFDAWYFEPQRLVGPITLPSWRPDAAARAAGSGAPRTYWRSEPLGDPREVPEIPSPDGRYSLLTADHDILVRRAGDGRTRPLTTDGTELHEWRLDHGDPIPGAGLLTAPAHWSPDGTRVAAYKVDVSPLVQVPQVHYLGRHDEVAWRLHAKAGGAIEITRLHVLDLDGDGEPVTLDMGDTRSTYPMFAAWLPGGREIVVMRMSRDCRRIDVLAADAGTGTTRELFSEVGDTFLRHHHDVYLNRNLGLWVAPEEERILWASERDGWRHLYVYDFDGKEERQLTAGHWPVERVLAVRDGWVYLSARPDASRPQDVHVARVAIDGGDLQQLTTERGVHFAELSPDDDVFFDAWSAPDVTPRACLRRLDGAIAGGEQVADATGLEAHGWSPPEQVRLTAADGTTDLLGVLFTPRDFNPARSYPLVEYVYGGPQLAIAPHGFATQAFFGRHAQALAELGCVTLVLDARGTPGRSKAFHDSAHRQWARHVVADHAGAVTQLLSERPYLDPDRVGVIGHSWGGHFAFRFLVERPDLYRAGVASGPGFDPYASILYEPYLGLPLDEPEAYADADALPLASRLERPFMLACGTADEPTWSDAMKLSHALVQAGCPHEFVALPEAGHVFDRASDAYFWGKVQAFIGTHLGWAA